MPDIANVLIVEDEFEVSELIKDVVSTTLGEVHIDVTPFGDEASKLLSQKTYDLITLDLNLKSKYHTKKIVDGIDILREVRQKYNGVPVIVISGSGAQNPAYVQKILEMGASKYMSKPFNISELQSVIREYIK